MPKGVSFDGERWEPPYVVLCERGCGQIHIVPASGVHTTARRHFGARHPGLVMTSSDYRYFPSPTRCDACLDVVEPPWWVHISDPPTNTSVVIDHDGIWVVCDACHDLFAIRHVSALVRRHMDVAKANTPLLSQRPDLAQTLRQEMAATMANLVINLDAGTRVTAREDL